MNKNTESYFAELPQIDIQRSIFDRSFGHKTSFNVGELIPFYWDEVLPGDTFQVSTSLVARLQTLLTPMMDNVYLDIGFFFSPNRILLDSWPEVMGENKSSAWIPATEHAVPVVSYPTDATTNNQFAVGTIADYLGVPVGQYAEDPDFDPDHPDEPDHPSQFYLVDFSGLGDDDCPSVLPFRCYAKICNEWYRDQNLSDPLNIPTDDSNQTGSNGSNYITDVVNGGKPFIVAKFHDLYTSCLPSPQKGASVPIPSFTFTDVPVLTGSDILTAYDADSPQLRFIDNSTSGNISRSVLTASGHNHGSVFDTYIGGWPEGSSNSYRIQPANLWANLSETVVTMPSINALRLAFQLQKFYEKSARAGTRYREVIREHFGATVPDSRMMIPEYLGGKRIPLNIHQIANTSMSDDGFLGDLGAMSNTADVDDNFVKSFTEHGIVMGVCCVRYDKSYSNGIQKAFLRRDFTDFYWPVFANIGEQPIHKRELYLGSDPDKNKAVFGYNEAYAEYRFKPSMISGELRPGIPNSLASWHLGDWYTDYPSLSDSWIREDMNIVDRVLAVGHTVSNQVFCDFYVKNVVTRAMPMHSIPGLIDHH